MDVRHITNLRSAIRAVMEGDLGPVRIQTGVFKHIAFEQMPVEKLRTIVKGCGARHAFDVEIGPMSMHEAAPVSNPASHETITYGIEIVCFTHKRSTLLNHDRTRALDYVLADGNEAEQALKYPTALETTLEGEQTLVVSGLMMGPGVAGTPAMTKPDEAWDQDLVRWSMIGFVILHVPQTAPE